MVFSLGLFMMLWRYWGLRYANENGTLSRFVFKTSQSLETDGKTAP